MDILAAGLFILLGPGFLAYGVIVLRKGYASRHWPSLEGRMIVSQVRLVEWEDGATIWPELEYEYRISQRTHRGRGIAFGREITLAMPSEVERLVTRYPSGEPVTVHYNPANPQEAVLEQGVGCSAHVAFLLGILLVVAGAWVGFWG